MAIPLDQYMPFDSGAGADVTEDGWRSMMRRGTISGVVRGIGNELDVIGNSTGMFVYVSDGECVIESYWGSLGASAPQPLAIPSNSAGSVRYDMAIVRANWVTNVIEFDILVGTAGSGAPPSPTRNTSQWEIPLAVVKVASGAVSIAAGDVYGCKQFGGPPLVTNTDDYLLFNDRISTCARYSVTSTNAVINSNLYVCRLNSPGEQTATEIRMVPSTLPVGGTTQVRIFRGPRQDLLTSFIDPTTSTFLYGGTAGNIHLSPIPKTTFRAGETIVIAVYGTSTSTAASLISNAVTWSGGNASNFLNPSTTFMMTTAFKTTGSMPSTLNLLDGSWTLRDRVFWAALA